MNENEIKQKILEEYNIIGQSADESVHSANYASYIPKGAHPKHLRLLKQALKRLPEGGHFLDVCVGAGIAARVLARLGYRVSVVESSAIAGNWQATFKNNDVEMIDIKIEQEALPISSDSVDFIYFGATLEHLQNSPRPILAEFKRVLKPGGVLFFDVPNFLCLRHRILMLLGKNVLPSMDYIYHADFHAEHHREYTLGDARKILEWSGFEIDELYLEDVAFKRSLVRQGAIYANRNANYHENETIWDYDQPFNAASWYDWGKAAVQPLMYLFPNMRDDIVAIAHKPNHSADDSAG